MRGAPSSLVIGYWSLVISATLLAGFLAHLATVRTLHPEEFLWGTLLALTQGGIAVWIDARALRGNPDYFMIWAVGAQNLRLFAVVAILGLAYRSGMANYAAFLSTALAGVVVMLAAQVLILHTRTMQAWRRNRQR
jgi:hypothetical protein